MNFIEFLKTICLVFVPLTESDKVNFALQHDVFHIHDKIDHLCCEDIIQSEHKIV